MLRLTHADIGITYKKQEYTFPDVNSVQIEDPLEKHKGRGMNAKNKKGFVYSSGTADPVKITITLKDVPVSYRKMFHTAFKDDVPVDFYAVDTVNGDTYSGNNCLISKEVLQTNISAEADYSDITLVLETFDYEEDLSDETHD